MNEHRFPLRSSSAWLGTIIFLAGGTAVYAQDVIDAVTAPSDKRKLSFNFPGVVRDVNVKEGDSVKAGQPLAQQDDDIEKSELERLEREAGSDARVAYYGR